MLCPIWENNSPFYSRIHLDAECAAEAERVRGHFHREHFRLPLMGLLDALVQARRLRRRIRAAVAVFIDHEPVRPEIGAVLAERPAQVMDHRRHCRLAVRTGDPDHRLGLMREIIDVLRKQRRHLFRILDDEQSGTFRQTNTEPSSTSRESIVIFVTVSGKSP